MNCLHHPSTIYHPVLKSIECEPLFQAVDKGKASLLERMLAIVLRWTAAFVLLGACTLSLTIWTFKTVTLLPMLWEGIGNHFINLGRDFLCVGYAVLLPFRPISLGVDESLILLSEKSSPERTVRRENVRRILNFDDPSQRKVWYEKMTVSLQRRDGANCKSLLHHLLKTEWYELSNDIIKSSVDFGITNEQLTAIFRDGLGKMILEQLFEGMDQSNAANGEYFNLWRLRDRLDVMTTKLIPMIGRASLYITIKEWIDSRRGELGCDTPYEYAEWDKFFRILCQGSNFLYHHGYGFSHGTERDNPLEELLINQNIQRFQEDILSPLYPNPNQWSQWLHRLFESSRFRRNDKRNNDLFVLENCAKLWNSVCVAWHEQRPANLQGQALEEYTKEMEAGIPSDLQIDSIMESLDGYFRGAGLPVPPPLYKNRSPIDAAAAVQGMQLETEETMLIRLELGHNP